MLFNLQVAPMSFRERVKAKSRLGKILVTAQAVIVFPIALILGQTFILYVLLIFFPIFFGLVILSTRIDCKFYLRSVTVDNSRNINFVYDIKDEYKSDTFKLDDINIIKQRRKSGPYLLILKKGKRWKTQVIVSEWTESKFTEISEKISNIKYPIEPQ